MRSSARPMSWGSTLSLGLSLLRAASALELTPPTGRYKVGATKQVIEFYNDDDPFAPDGIQTSFLATIYYPTLAPTCTEPVPVLEPELAEIYEKGWGWRHGDLASLTASLSWDAPSLPEFEAWATMPTIVFGPGGVGPPSSCYTIMHTELASLGYTVAALDHFYEQPFLRYPNGTGVVGQPIDGNFTDDQTTALYNARLRDTLFFLDQWPSLVDKLRAPFDKSRIGAYGHSFGGAVSLGAAIDSPAILSALNMDGSNFGKAVANNSSADAAKPVMQLGQDGHTELVDPTWGVFPRWQSGWWETVLVRGAAHLDFSDAAFWKRLPTNKTMGTIASDRMVDVMRTFVTAFFNMTLLGQEEPILEGNSTGWPEVYIWDGSEF